jgi:uncharacterized protein (DUF849 family)
MNALYALAEQAVINGVLSKNTPFMRKNKVGLGLAALSGLLFFTSVVFAIIAAYGWLLATYAQPIAALIVAAAVLGGSIIVGFTGYALLRKRPKPAMQEGEITTLIADAVRLIDEELAEPVQDNPKTAVALAGLAGFVAGEYLH